MPNRGYRGVAGEPVLPYVDHKVMEGSDTWLTLQFLDRNNNPAIPTAIQYRIDCLTTDYVVLGPTGLPTPFSSSQIVINIPAALNLIGGGPDANDVGQNSQLNQVLIQATFSDGSVQQQVFIYEVIAIQTVGGAPAGYGGLVTGGGNPILG